MTLINAPAAPSPQNFKNFTPQDRYNFAPANYLQDPLKDVSLYVQGHYDIFDNVTFTANAEYIRDESKQLLAATPLSLGVATSTRVNGVPVSIAANQKYNPFGIALISDSNDPCIRNGTCEQLTFLDRRQLEAGPRITSRPRDNFHIFLGFNGYFNLLNREIDWDVGFAQNRVQRENIHNGSFNIRRLSRALGPPTECTAPCVPFNFFGGSVVGDGGSITQEQLAYTTFESHNVAQTNLRDWTANLSSNIYNLPAGPLGVAIGYERLDAYGYYKPDALIAAGDTTGSAVNPTNGRVVTDAEYAELNIPLLADLPGIESLSVDIANRWSQFKRAGGITGQATESFVHDSSGRLNIRYQVINDLLLRATWSQGFRTPNINELFAGQHGSGAGLSDPCAPPPGSYNGGVLPQNCPNGTPDLQSNTQVHTTVGGNPDLRPESSISRTAGFVYSPSEVPGLDINADYFKIELTNAVSTVGAQNIMNSCFFNSTLCDLVTTRGNHVTDIRNINTNIGSELVEGEDVGLRYKFPSTFLGDFSARINGTFLKTYDRTVLNLSTRTGFATSHLAGVDEYAKRRFNGYLNWDYGNLSLHYHMEYIDSVVEACREALDLCTYPNRTADYQGTPGQFNGGRNHLGGTVYHDINASYTMPQLNATISIGVRNLFDKVPPISRVPHTNNYNVYLYRLPSRFIYGDIRIKF